VSFSGAITVSAGNFTGGIVPNGERPVDHIAAKVQTAANQSRPKLFRVYSGD
jgi:hypothetical protein